MNDASNGDTGIARLPELPYYSVIFTSQRNDHDVEGYAQAADWMMALAAQQPGFLGAESVRGNDGVGITVSYWQSEAAILAWKQHAKHTAIRDRGRREWYSRYALRVAKVERVYQWDSTAE